VKKIEINRREKKSAETKAKIYRSAELLFGENGLENVSLNTIINHAGVSKGAFYSHFDSKDSLEAEFIKDIIDRMNFSYEIVFADEAMAAAKFSSLLEKVAHNITEELGHTLVKTAGMIQIRKSMNHEMLMSFNKGLCDAVYKLITVGIEQGEFKTADSAEAIAEDIIMTIRGFIFEWIVRYPDMDLNACLQKHFRSYFAGL
jgi:AcrR family transcriptional regulator